MTPTPTWPWMTPTPFPTLDATPFIEAASKALDAAQQIIAGYNFVNQGGVLSAVFFFFMSMLIIGLLSRALRRAKESAE